MGQCTSAEYDDGDVTDFGASSEEEVPDVLDIRQNLLQLINRPQVHPQPTAWDTTVSDDNVTWVRFSIRSEPSYLGTVPVLMSYDANKKKALPVVIVLHGTGSSKDDPSITKQLTKFAKDGYLGIAIDSRCHGDRSKFDKYSDALISAWKQDAKPARHPFIYETVWDLMRLIDYLETVDIADSDRIGITGVSLGGMHAWFASVVDSRISAVAPAIGVQSFRYALLNDCYAARIDTIRGVFEVAQEDINGLSGEVAKSGSSGNIADDHIRIDKKVVKLVWDRICPGLLNELDAPSSLQCIAPRPLLVLTGERDPRCPLAGVRLAFEKAKERYDELGYSQNIDLFVEEGVEHEMTDNMWQRIHHFMNRNLLPS